VNDDLSHEELGERVCDKGEIKGTGIQVVEPE